MLLHILLYLTKDEITDVLTGILTIYYNHQSEGWASADYVLVFCLFAEIYHHSKPIPIIIYSKNRTMSGILTIYYNHQSEGWASADYGLMNDLEDFIFALFSRFNIEDNI